MLTDRLLTSMWMFCVLVLATSPSSAQPPDGETADVSAISRETALEPADALASLSLPEGLTVELVAAEPEVIDPVAIRFDGQGRMWVVEMRDYPHGPAEGEKPASRIRVLEDRDHDGRYETSRVFADELLFATGLQPWKDGVIVTLAGRVAYLKDTDGDGRADHEETWFVGFAEENSQLRANHPTLALDNQIYIANGLRGGEVRDTRQPASEPVSIRSNDFRFDPRGSRYEAISGFGQFGLTFDAFGRRFECSNRNPLRHIVLEDRYIRANPAIPIPDTGWDVAAWGEDSKLYPLTRAWTTSTLHANQFTAACGVHIYRDSLLPAMFQGAAFTCDPTGNLVHCEVMRPAGATFQSQPFADGVEFLASTDEWFRPVNLELGPEGALYIVDMYRAVIEHPQFMPDELKQRKDLRYGTDRGRIYRIRPANATEHQPPPELDRLSNGELVERLSSDRAWDRETAHRLLLEREAGEVADALRSLATGSPAVLARQHAWWILAGLDQLTPADVQRALADDAAAIREHACVLAERWLGDESAGLRTLVVALADDPDPRVRFQAALSLGPVRGDTSEVTALARIASGAAADVWTRRAVALSSGSAAPEVALATLDALAGNSAEPESSLAPDRSALVEELFGAAALVREPAPQLLQQTLARAAHPVLRQAALRGLLRGWTRQRANIDQLVEQLGAEHAERWQSLLAAADRDVLNEQLELSQRVAALELLSLGRQTQRIIDLATREDVQPALRSAAISRLPGDTPSAAWQELFGQYPAAAPALRSAIVSAALNHIPACEVLLEKIEAGDIKPQELGRVEANRLLQHGHAAIKQRAAELFAAATPQERQQVLARYQQALQLSADPLRGREVFAKNCATCHRIGSLGVDVAPDIADSRTKTPAQLLTDILQPNQAIDGNYIAFALQTVDGRTFSGILTGETASGVTLKIPEGQSLTLQRDEIDILRSTGVSLMPEGLEQNVSIQQMADLISFIKNWRYLDQQALSSSTESSQ